MDDGQKSVVSRTHTGASWVATAFVVAVALVLYLDSQAFALTIYPPGSERVTGCYTLLDNLLGTKAPLDGLRYLEAGLALVLPSFGLPFLWRRRPPTVENAAD